MMGACQGLRSEAVGAAPFAPRSNGALSEPRFYDAAKGGPARGPSKPGDSPHPTPHYHESSNGRIGFMLVAGTASPRTLRQHGTRHTHAASPAEHGDLARASSAGAHATRECKGASFGDITAIVHAYGVPIHLRPTSSTSPITSATRSGGE